MGMVTTHKDIHHISDGADGDGDDGDEPIKIIYHHITILKMMTWGWFFSFIPGVY